MAPTSKGTIMKSKHNISGIVFFFGIFVGLALAAIPIWSAFEAQAYYFTGETFEPFNGLHCPMLMTTSETKTITATFDNPSNQEIQPYYQVVTSGPLPQKFENQFSIPPHTSKTVQWTVDENEIDMESFAFSKIEILPDSDHSTRRAICGIMMLNVPGLSGDQIFWLLFIISLLAITIGFVMWERSLDQTKDSSVALQRAMQFMGVAVLLAMLTAFMGWWLVGLAFGIIVILLMVISLRFTLR